MNKRYGLKEVANVVFFNIATGKPELFLDTLKVSTIENEAETAEARGGQGNGKLMSWDYGRTATLNLQDALLSDVSLSKLAGTELQTTGIVADGIDKLTVVGGEVTLRETPKGAVAIYKVEGGLLTDEITGATVTGQDVTLTGVTDGQKVMAFYKFDASADARKVTFSANAFPDTYRVVGETFVRDEATGKDRRAQFLVPKAKLQSAFSLTMDVENVSTFDFNLEVLVEAETQDLYEIIRL